MIKLTKKHAVTKERAKAVFSALLVLAIIPFAILSFYSFPAVDDYSFAYEVNRHGFWGAQEHWYLNWTGRYFSTFILSLNPLLVGSNLMYQVINFLVLIASVHCLFFLMRKSEVFIGRGTPIILSLILSLAYLSHLPDLTQAFYWLPGSITYQLSMIACTYIIALLLVDSRSESGSNSFMRLAVIMVLTIIACASNEIMMIVTNFVFLLSLIYSIFWRRRGGYIRSISLQLWGIIAGLIVVFAPGNKVRGGENFSPFDFAVFNEQIVSSLDASELFLQSYLLIPILPLLLIGGLSAKTNPNSKASVTVLVSSIIIIFVLIVVFITFFTSYLSVGLAPPARSQNTCFWFLVLGSFFLGVVLARAGISSILNSQTRYLLSSACVCVILLFPYKTGFEYSVYDLLSGSANEFRTQYHERESILIESDNQAAVLPAFSAYPNSVYLNDLSKDVTEWWNVLTAVHYNLESVKVDYGNLQPVLSYQVDYANPIEFAMNIDPAQVDTRQSSLGQSLYLQSSSQTYGPGILLPYHEIWQSVKHKFSYIKVKSLARISDSDKLVHIVISLNGGSGQTLLWRSKEWEFDGKTNLDDFHANEFFLPIDAVNHRAIESISMYIWNPNQATVELSSMEIELY